MFAPSNARARIHRGKLSNFGFLKYFLVFTNERYYLKGQQLDPILSQMNPTQAFKISLFIVHINIILPSLPSSLQSSFTKILYIFPIYSTFNVCIDCLKSRHFRTVITFGASYKSWSSSLCNFLHPTVTSFPFAPQYPSHIPFPYALHRRYFLQITQNVTPVWNNRHVMNQLDLLENRRGLHLFQKLSQFYGI